MHFLMYRFLTPVHQLVEVPRWLHAIYRRHKGEKQRAYKQRAREVERGSFMPLVFSTSGGMGRAATVVYKRLASLLSSRREQRYSMVLGWLRCCLSFSLLRSVVMCLRGSRSRCNHSPRTSLDQAVHEGRSYPPHVLIYNLHFFYFIMSLVNTLPIELHCTYEAVRMCAYI